jgi:hypothetical protein
MKPAPARPAAAGRALVAGAVYFALVFALGFVLGTMRALLVPDAAGSGRLLAVLIELPVMLSASWLLCRAVVRRFAVAPTAGTRLAMGGVAFALLMGAELLIGTLLAGRSPAAHLALYREPSYSIGLLAQIAFGWMPLLQGRLGLARR